MHDDTNSSNQSEQSQAKTQNADDSAMDAGGPACIHTYHEVTGDLLAKPNLLCEILEAQNLPASVIFCNSPSDADFIDVILKKRSIPSRKLIGHVPPGKILESLSALREGKLCALIMTDVSAESLNGDCFKFVINYAVPADPDTYLERIARACAKAKETCTVISLIGPLDISNFHYIKKLVGSEFTKLDAPPPTDIIRRRTEGLLKTARQAALNDERLSQMAAIILEDNEAFDAQAKKDLLIYLLNNTVNAPSNSGASSSREREDRSDRNGYGRNSQSRDRRRGGRYSRDRDAEHDSGSEDAHDEGGGDNRSSDSRRSFGSNRDRQRGDAPKPSVKELRYYIGHGQKDGFNQEELVNLLKQVSGDDFKPDVLKRFTLRDLYSFADFPQDQAPALFEALSKVNRSNEQPLFICKATSIYPPRANEDEGEDEGGAEARPSAGFNDREEEETGSRASFDDEE